MQLCTRIRSVGGTLQTSAERLENNVVEVSVTVDAKAVDKAIADTYKELAKKYQTDEEKSSKSS